MDEEVANIATALSNVTVTEEAGVKVTRGTLETNKGTAVNVAATVGGMGTVNIAATTQHLIDADQPDAVIFSGIAGNLNTNLHINDVVLGAISTPTCDWWASSSPAPPTGPSRNTIATTVCSNWPTRR